MKPQKRTPAPPATLDAWQKTPYANLVRYVPSGKYFARMRVRGKLIRQSLKTKVISVAKLRLADLEKDRTPPFAPQHKIRKEWLRVEWQQRVVEVKEGERGHF